MKEFTQAPKKGIDSRAKMTAKMEVKKSEQKNTR